MSVRAAIAAGQHRLAKAIGVDEQKRSDTVMAMHANNARSAPGYWLQLFLSMCIATLGLVLDSTAVVIGAMLVSPLMGPIIELGMGFAVGSSLLVIRAFFRTTISLLAVVAGAATLTMALPFHQVTSEISTRTAPTAIDLLIAILCALAAAYATMRNTSDTTVAAAGTAVGIALMPPLCTVGFGVGTGAASIATGAALLVTANLSAIIVFAGLAFFALGFNQVDAVAIEGQFVERGKSDHAASVAHRVLSRVFRSRFGPAMRVAIPIGLLAAVSFPLSHALDDVTWEIRTREAIRRVLEREAPGAVQTSLAVDRGAIGMRLLLVGSLHDAAAAERRVRRMVAEASGVEPSVSIVAVADGRLLAAATKAEASASPTVSPAIAASETKANVGRALAALWSPEAGRVVGWQLSISANQPASLLVYHLGPPVGAPGMAMLASALSAQVGLPLLARETAISSARVMRRGNDLAWVDTAVSLLAAIGATDSVVACVEAPGPARSARDRATLARLEQAGVPPSRLMVSSSRAWSIQAVMGTCAESKPVE